MELSRDEVRTLYESYGHVVYHRCLSMLRDEEEAHDAMQEVFVRLIRNADHFRGEAAPLTWLYRISTNFCLNRIRDRQSRAKKLAEPNPTAATLPGMSAFANIDPERRSLVASLLAQVDEQTRAIVVYYFVDEMTLDEISTLVEMSVPTLRKRIRHFQSVARRKMDISAATMVMLAWAGVGFVAERYV